MRSRRNNDSGGSVYNSRPYHALYISDDEEDDDICVWKDCPSLSDFNDSEEEPLAGHFRNLEVGTKLPKYPKNKGKAEDQQSSVNATSKSTNTLEDWIKSVGLSKSDIDPRTNKLTREAFREREVQYALSTTRRNLTHISQFLLKLEARAGKATKEGIRQTLDATVRDKNYDFNACGPDGGPPDPDHKSEIEELKYLSGEIYNRLYLVDRNWRRLSREARKEERSPDITILGEPDIKEWVKVELETNDISSKDACFFTTKDLACNRSFREWITYLQELCNFSDHHSDQVKLVDLAWRFLDRNLRPPRPVNPTTVEQFIADLEGRRSGMWDEVRSNLKKQEEDNFEAWKTLRRYWSSRTAPY